MPASDSLRFQAYFRRREGLAASLVSRILELPSELRPSHYGLAERVRRSPQNSLSDLPKAQKFLSVHGDSCCLYGKRISFGFLPYARDVLTCSIWGSESDSRLIRNVDAIIAMLDECRAIYGFGASWDEYEARNGYQYQYIEGGSVSGFCGRAFQKYVPGLYWINYFSNAYCEQMQINVPAIAEALDADVALLPSGIRLRLYDNPIDWKAHSIRVSDTIHQTRGFFSIRNVVIPTNLSKFDRDVVLLSTDWP